MSALRSFDAWLVASEILTDLPAAFKAEREARGESISSAARGMVSMTPYRVKKFEEGRGADIVELRSILLWMAAGRKVAPDAPRDR